VGRETTIRLKDCGRLALQADEQVTFVTPKGAEYDVVRKSWGFYATPSLNDRLVRFGLLAALVKSPDGKFYVMLVERDKEAEFKQYLKTEKQRLICWLHRAEQLEALEKNFTAELQ
jgi:hypothetical protein